MTKCFITAHRNVVFLRKSFLLCPSTAWVTGLSVSQSRLDTRALLLFCLCLGKKSSSCEPEWHIIFVSVFSGFVVGVLFSYLVSFSRRKFQSRKQQSSPAPQPSETDTTYQELDLSKMNQEDNYQSLRVNSACNDEESAYTELNKTRDAEDNYQSLT